MKRRTIVTVANEKVPIATVCQMLGVDLPDIHQRVKLYCPFGGTDHSDAGLAPAMRIYPESNHAYCFACTAYFTPVRMAAKALDLSWTEAARLLLDRIGYQPI